MREDVLEIFAKEINSGLFLHVLYINWCTRQTVKIHFHWKSRSFCYITKPSWQRRVTLVLHLGTMNIEERRSALNQSTNGVLVDSPSKKTNVSVRLVAFPCRLIEFESIILWAKWKCTARPKIRICKNIKFQICVECRHTTSGADQTRWRGVYAWSKYWWRCLRGRTLK